VAYHEMGHALVAMSLPGQDPIQKISIIPRGIGALGYTIQRPTEDRYLMTRTELQNKMAVLLGGRAAEQLVFGEVSTGAADDLQKVTEIADSVIMRYGMDETLGNIVYDRQRPTLLNVDAFGSERRQHSEDTAREIDKAIRQLVEAAYQLSLQILKERRAELERGAGLLLEKETLAAEDLEVFKKTVSPEGALGAR